METPRTTGGKGSTPLPAIIPPTAKTAKRNIRSLATLADEICALRARSIFELGDLLDEAKAACEPGKWLSWLKTEVDYSDDTASRYMAAAQLGNRFRKLRNLNLAKSTIYALVNLDKEEREALGLEAVNDPDLTDEDSTESSHLSAIIDELAERSAGGKLTAAAAKDVFRIVPLRAKFGEFPDATLFALEQIDGEPWAETATAVIQAQRPITDEAAKTIINDARRNYVVGLYDGRLPDLPMDAYGHLQGVAPEHRASVLQRIEAGLTADRVREICDRAFPQPANDGDDTNEEGVGPRPEDIKRTKKKKRGSAPKRPRSTNGNEQAIDSNGSDTKPKRYYPLDLDATPENLAVALVKVLGREKAPTVARQMLKRCEHERGSL
jgi:DUF3102 family protein